MTNLPNYSLDITGSIGGVGLASTHECGEFSLPSLMTFIITFSLASDCFRPAFLNPLVTISLVESFTDSTFFKTVGTFGLLYISFMFVDESVAHSFLLSRLQTLLNSSAMVPSKQIILEP
ncbi:unnamed protein product [Schistosoma bovis]|nr:unnamed protein product [Schistosoma bovis]